MHLEDYFDFLTTNDIRLKGTRIGIETILYDFIYRSKSPDAIAQTYPSLSLEQVYATITYYLHKREKITQYLTEWLEHGERMWIEQQRNPHLATLRLRKIKNELELAKQTDHNLDVSVKLQELSVKYNSQISKVYAAT